MTAIRRILCPLDFSIFSRHALEQAIAVAREFGAGISALHVLALSPVVETVPAGAHMGTDPLSLSAARRAALTAQLHDFTSEVDARGVQLRGTAACLDRRPPPDTPMRTMASHPRGDKESNVPGFPRAG